MGRGAEAGGPQCDTLGLGLVGWSGRCCPLRGRVAGVVREGQHAQWLRRVQASGRRAEGCSVQLFSGAAPTAWPRGPPL